MKQYTALTDPYGMLGEHLCLQITSLQPMIYKVLTANPQWVQCIVKLSYPWQHMLKGNNVHSLSIYCMMNLFDDVFSKESIHIVTCLF